MINEAKEKYLSLVHAWLTDNQTKNQVNFIDEVVMARQAVSVCQLNYCDTFNDIKSFLSSLKEIDKEAWSQLLSYAWGSTLFQELKALSPFSGMTYVQLTNVSGYVIIHGEIPNRLMGEVERRVLDNGKIRSTYAIFFPLKVEEAQIQETL